jgi:hypothetical protein
MSENCLFIEDIDKALHKYWMIYRRDRQLSSIKSYLVVDKF